MKNDKEVGKNKAGEYINFRHQATLFKNIFKTLGSVNSEAKLYFTGDKIKTLIVDPAHVLMITVEIPNRSIEEYKTFGDPVLGFDLIKLNYILKGGNKNDVFEFLYDSDKDLFKSFIKNGLFNHTCHLLDADNLPDAKIPTLDLPVRIRLDTKILHDFLVQADKISDYIKITATRDDVTFFAEGDVDKVSITLDRSQLVFYDCGSEYKSLFSVDHLLSIVKQLKTLFGKIELNMSNDNPLRIIGNDNIKVEVLLAPRIGDE